MTEEATNLSTIRDGRVGCAETGSREPDPSSTGSGPTGFDPARGVKRQLLVQIGRRCIREHAGADCDEEIVGMVRQAAKRVTGGNCMFADDDLNILEHLALRAVEAGLTDGLHPRVAASAIEARQGEDATEIAASSSDESAVGNAETPNPSRPSPPSGISREDEG